MNRFACVKLLFSLILVLMVVVTTWASWHEGVWTGGGKLLAEPWGVATLADAYCGFLTFYVWVFYKEHGFLARTVWLIAILLLGNIAMATYVLMQLSKLPHEAGMRELFTRRGSA